MSVRGCGVSNRLTALQRGDQAPKQSSPGGQLLCSELAIELVLTLRLVFPLALCQVEAFSRGVLRLLGLALSTPDTRR